MDWFKRIACLLNPEAKADRRDDDVPVKIIHEEEIRRTSVPRDIKLNQLQTILREKFSIAPTHGLRVSFAVLKDDPYSSLENQFDLDTAIQCAITAQPVLLRLKVETVKEEIDDWQLVAGEPRPQAEADKMEKDSAEKKQEPEPEKAMPPPKSDVPISQQSISQAPRNKYHLFLFEEHLITLHQMGFTNRELNIRLLVANVGNLEDTIEALTRHVDA